MKLAASMGLTRSVASIIVALMLTVVPARTPALAQAGYAIDGRFGSITFSVSHLGLFSSEGQFRTFDAALAIDPSHVERTRIDVEVAAASVVMDWPDGAAKLRSADFFDTARYPRIHFVSTEVVPASPGTFRVKGRLTIRGVTHPLVLMATLIGVQGNKAGTPKVADFVVTGKLSRSAYGMDADRLFISDTVDLTIRARIRLADAAHG
ncbi:MAG: YceI family protein [Acetobacteraceae bacterium]